VIIEFKKKQVEIVGGELQSIKAGQAATGEFVGPRELFQMFQTISFPAFKIWACLIAHHTENNNSLGAQKIPVTEVWLKLGGRISHSRLENRLEELQKTLIKRNEYLPTEQEITVNTFQALGPTSITSNVVGDVTSIQYQMLEELVILLKEKTEKEKFIVELRAIMTLSGDQGGAAAKNLMFLCTPYIPSGKTPSFKLTDIQNFMDLQTKYNNADGSINVKAFLRDIIRKARSTINDNPYMSFTITDITKITEKRITVALIFHLKAKARLLTSVGTTITEDTSSPINPEKLKTILINYWIEYVKDPNVSLAPDILIDTLKEFRLVDKYLETFFDVSDYKIDPVVETNRIMSIATAIFQSWMDGIFKKENSKIYAYTIRIFQNPIDSQILSLVKKFLIYANIKLVTSNKKALDNKGIELKGHHNKQLRKLIRSFLKNRFETTISSHSPDSIKDLDQKFVALADKKKLGIWIQKAVQNISHEDKEKPLLAVLSRTTLTFYKNWLINQDVKNKLTPELSIPYFLSVCPAALPHFTFLNLSTKIPFTQMEMQINEK
jgi:hypothetical protein